MERLNKNRPSFKNLELHYFSFSELLQNVARDHLFLTQLNKYCNGFLSPMAFKYLLQAIVRSR